jgi:hypothetical protein
MREIVKNNDRKVNEQQQVTLSGNPGTSDGLPASDNSHEPNKQSGGWNGDVAEASGKSLVSTRKVEANPRNSRKSTGPKTAAGKKRVSRNAIKHGFYSKYLLVGSEDRAEYDDLYADVRKHYQPLGWLEELWVEKIAVCSWRLRRLVRCESGQIARALAGHSYELQQSKADDLAEPASAPSSNPEMDALTDHLFLPEKEELDKLLRYEAMITRQLNHAIAELERIQARRKGDISPE